ncbi:MAG: S9 family peptidase, partial [Gammaproteobacteria bacterium]
MNATPLPAAGPVFGVAGLLVWAALLTLVASTVIGDGERATGKIGYPASYPANYPASPRGTVVDNYHGTAVADPWRWLEDLPSPETQIWIGAENALTQRALAGLPGRDRFAARLRALLDYERRGVPDRENGVYVYPWNPGSAEQNVLRVTGEPGETGRVLVDPAVIGPDGTVSIDDFKLDPAGARLAYSLSDGGSDWKTWHVRTVATGTDVPEVLEGTKFTAVSWSRDGRGFYYSRYPASPAAGYDDQRQVAVHFHVPGTLQATDPLVYAITDHKTRDPYATATPDGRFLVLNI